MTDSKKAEDPALIPETELDDVNAGFTKVPDLYSGGKVVDSFVKIEEQSFTVDVKPGRDVLSTSINTDK